MILLAHMLFGAAFGANIPNPYLALALAFLGHYFLDLFPHVEYSVDNIRNKNWRKSFFDVVKVIIDFLLAIIIISLFSNKEVIIYLCAFITIIPDAFTVISSVFENKILKMHDKIHTEKIHYLTKQKKFSLFWRIATQALAIIISIALLR